jgi:cyclopropane-fatty-acyl-phospholipid synthase
MKHTLKQDQKAIAHHYDVGNDFYELFLDENKIYSCAYFKRPEDTLEQAQAQKLDHICKKLRLQEGETFLDIGCGWGGLILHAARHYGVKAMGITLSQEQYQLACQRIDEAGLASTCEVQLKDYRLLPGNKEYDKMASIGMVEHVGLKNLQTYFDVAFKNLKDHGLFLNHGITSSNVKKIEGTGSKFMDVFIFPQSELIPISHMTYEAEKAGFEILDMESLRRHYEKTLKHWAKRLQAKKDEALKIVSEKTYRAWVLYMAGCVESFRSGRVNIYQSLLAKQGKQLDAMVPLTRDWLYA